MERWQESEVGNGKRQVGLLWEPAFGCCHAATVVLYIHFGEERGGAPRLLHSREPSYSAKQEAGVRAAGTCLTSPWYRSGTGEL